MTRREGPKGVALVELASRRKQSYIVRTDLQPYQTDEADGVTFIEQRYDYKPTMEDIRAFVFGVINEKVKARILSGFEWDGKPVWLSEENQMNFAQAVVPATFKIGEWADGSPVYRTFDSEELTAFNTAWRRYIQQCLADGWRQKDGYDFGEYEEELSSVNR